MVSIFYTLLKALIVALTFGVHVITTIIAGASGIITSSDGTFLGTIINGESAFNPITPFDIFFNKYKLLDINFFDFTGVDEDSFIYVFRETVAEWYAITRLISCSILLVILLYVGIRMSMSTVADDKAKYKRMLADWVVSLVLIFILQYIIIFTIYCNNAIVSALRILSGSDTIIESIGFKILLIATNGIVGAGIESMASVIVYVMIVFQTIGFLLAYIKRMIKVGFLIMISPLISITYSIDKMGDGKAQALGNWLKEFVYTILIQPFHCVAYLALVKTAFDLLVTPTPIEWLEQFISPTYVQLTNGILAILCLKFVSDAEKIVRKIFGFQDDNSSTSMAAGVAMGVAALTKAKDVGAKTRKNINKTKALYGKALKNDLGVLSKTRAGQFITDRANKHHQKVDDKKSAKEEKKKEKNNLPLPDSKQGENGQTKKDINGAKTSQDGTKMSGSRRFLEKAKETAKEKGSALAKKTWDSMKQKASLSNALGIMAAAMAYSSGSTSAMEAIGLGSKVQEGTQEFFSSSTKAESDRNSDFDDVADEFAVEGGLDQLNNLNESDDFKVARKAMSESVKASASAEFHKEESERLAKKIAKKEKSNNSSYEELKELKDLKRIHDTEAKSDMKIAEQKRKEAEESWEKVSITDEEGNTEHPPKDWLEKTIDESGNENSLEKFKENVAEGIYDNAWKKAAMGPNSKDIDAELDAIRQLVLQAQLNKSGVKSFNELTVDEQASVNATTELLKNKIGLSVLNNTSFGQEEMKQTIIDNLGLNRDGDNKFIKGVSDFEKSSELFSHIQQYEHYMRWGQIAETYQNNRSYNGTDESLRKKDVARSVKRFK